MSFAKFLINKLRARDPGYDGAHGLPIRAVEGGWYSTLTVGDSHVEIDWDVLQKEIEALEAEFTRADSIPQQPL